MRARRIMLAVAAVVILAIALVLTAIVLNREPSLVGSWSFDEPTEWIEFSDRKNEDFFAPSHDGTWIRHRGEDSISGMWVHVPGDRHSFDMISHVSGPMWVKDGRVTLDGRKAQWKQGFSGDNVRRLTWRSAEVPSSKVVRAQPTGSSIPDVSSTAPVQF